MIRPALLALLLSLAGCSALTGPREDFAIYTLDPSLPAASAPAVTWQLLIEPPHVNELLDGMRIVIAPHGNERQVYKGARWIEPTPGLLQGIWLRSFEADGRLPGAARAGSGVRADLILASDLTEFQANRQADATVVEVELHARLVDPVDRRIRAREVFHAEVPVASDQVADAVVGFEAALAQINPALIAWTLREGERALAARSAETAATASDDR